MMHATSGAVASTFRPRPSCGRAHTFHSSPHLLHLLRSCCCCSFCLTNTVCALLHILSDGHTPSWLNRDRKGPPVVLSCARCIALFRCTWRYCLHSALPSGLSDLNGAGMRWSLAGSHSLVSIPFKMPCPPRNTPWRRARSHVSGSRQDGSAG